MREHRMSYSTPARDISGGVVVCVITMSAGHTPELRLAFPVTFVDMPAFRAFAAGISRIDNFARNSGLLGFVLHKGAKLAKRPVVQSFPLLFSGLNLASDVRQVFQPDTKPGAFRSGYDCFGNAVVFMLLKPLLNAAQLAQAALCCSGAYTLKRCPALYSAFSIGFNLRTGIFVTKTVCGNVHDAEINTEHSVRRQQGRIVKVTDTGDIPFAANQHQINFAFSMLQQFALMVAANESNFLSSAEQPDGNHIARHYSEDTVIIRLRRMFTKLSHRLLVNFVAIGNLLYALDSHLRSQLETRTKFSIECLLHVILPNRFGAERLFREPIAGFITAFKRRAKQDFLFLRRMQLYVGYEFHASSMEGVS